MIFQPTALNGDGFNILRTGLKPYPLHWHNHIEIICPLSGSFTAEVRGKKHNVDEGDILICGSCEPHLIEKCEPNTQVLLISLSMLFCGQSVFKEIIKNRIEDPVVKTDRNLNALAAEILRDYKERKSVESELNVRGNLYLFLSAILNKAPTSQNMSDSHKKRLELTMKIQKALDLVSSCYNERITIERVASISGYEKSAFCRIFRNATGITFHKYLNDYRIKRAILLIEDGSYTLAEISDLVGIVGQKNFSRIFKSTVGVSPSEYKKSATEWE